MYYFIIMYYVILCIILLCINPFLISLFLRLWHVDPLLGNDREISSYKIDVAR
jgi:hypothetical protein